MLESINRNAKSTPPPFLRRIQMQALMHYAQVLSNLQYLFDRK